MGTKEKGMSFFGVWMKTALEENRMIQKDLAYLLDTSEPVISRYIHGGRIPHPDIMQKILDIFDCHIEIVPNEKGKRE